MYINICIILIYVYVFWTITQLLKENRTINVIKCNNDSIYEKMFIFLFKIFNFVHII